jgi:hypothetical protein
MVSLVVAPNIHGARKAINSKTAPDIESRTRNTLYIAQFSQARPLFGNRSAFSNLLAQSPKSQALNKRRTRSIDHLRRHRHLNRALILTVAAGVHRADRPATDQTGRDEIQTLRRLFANEALLAAAVTADLIGRL